MLLLHKVLHQGLSPPRIPTVLPIRNRFGELTYLARSDCPVQFSNAIAPVLQGCCPPSLSWPFASLFLHSPFVSHFCIMSLSAFLHSFSLFLAPLTSSMWFCLQSSLKFNPSMFLLAPQYHCAPLSNIFTAETGPAVYWVITLLRIKKNTSYESLPFIFLRTGALLFPIAQSQAQTHIGALTCNGQHSPTFLMWHVPMVLCPCFVQI